MSQATTWTLRSARIGRSAATMEIGPSRRGSRSALKHHARISDWMAMAVRARATDVTATSTMILRGPIGRARIVCDMAVFSEQDDSGAYIVSDGLFHVYGCGRTEDAALADYREALAEYASLVAASERVEDRALRARLRTYVELDQ